MLQISLIFATYFTASWIFYFDVEDGFLRTFILLFAVIQIGIHLIKKQKICGRLANANVFKMVWVCKLLLVLLVIHMGWFPQLEPNYPDWGYDPQRYYIYAKELIENNWSTLVDQNYMGIIYYYAGIMWLFGVNPYAPALINCMISFLAIFFILRDFTRYCSEYASVVKYMVWLIVFPELLWYDSITSRETLIANLLIIGCISSCRFQSSRAAKERILNILIIIFAVCGIAMVRTSMIIPIVLSFIVYAVLSNGKAILSRANIIAVMLVSFILFLAPILQSFAGGYSFDFVEQVQKVLTFEQNAASDSDEWSDKSLGLLLAPNNLYQAVLFTPLRLLLYIVSPLPTVNITLKGLIDGEWTNWQSLFVVPSSLILVFCFGYFIAGSLYCFNSKKNTQGFLPYVVSAWAIMLTVAGGNIIIHERYRIMFVVLYLALSIIGLKLTSSQDRMKINGLATMSIFLVGLLAILYKLS